MGSIIDGLFKENKMQVDIQARAFSLTKALNRYARQKLVSSLACCEDSIQRVVMRLSDINGPRGGQDKLCHIQVVLAGLPDVIIEDTEVDMYDAIDQATARAGHATSRKRDKHKTVLRRDRHAHGRPSYLVELQG